MKMTRRIFIALLILAVSVSSVAVFASAEEVVYNVQDYVNVLEYYEEQGLMDYDFGGEGVDYSGSLLVNRTNQTTVLVGEDTSVPSGKSLSVAIKEKSGRNTYTDNHAYFTWSSLEAVDDFNIDMTVSGAKNTAGTVEQNLPKIIVVVGENEFTSMSGAKTNGVTIASVGFRGGYFSYRTAADKETVTDYAVEEGKWYNVSLTYDVDNGVTITVTEVGNEENTLTVTSGYVPFASVKNIRVGAHGDDAGTARGSVMKFSDLRILGGVYHRELADMQSDIESKVLEMYDFFLDDTQLVEDKIVVCEVVDKLVAYGFTSENADVNKALNDLSVGMFGLYNTKIENFISSVDSLPTFAEKKELATETLGYAEALQQLDPADASSDMIARTEKNIADFHVVNERLKVAEAESQRFLAIVESVKDHDINDYPTVKADVALFEGVAPDLTYEGVAAAYKIYTNIATSEEEIRTSAEKFIAAVNVANNEELDFNTRAEAYTSIEELYYDNETYPGVTEAIAIYNSDLVAFMNREISNAQNFIMYVNKADYAIYISAKQENLDIAKTYMDICQPSFAGVAEAKVLYAEIQAYIDQQIDKANAYIAAVNKLDSLTGSALLAAIKEAEDLQKAGNVLGVDGVTEANIKLNQTIASIELREKYCVYFLSVMESLDKAANATETYAILAEAREAESYADKSYAGVAEASNKLAKAIEDFNAQINAINNEFEKANNVAANTCGVGGAAKPVSNHVIALVKKFYED
jgi:hypothetical protein